jgi:hypothetical protein
MMETAMMAIEVTGTIDERQQLQLDTLLPVRGPKRVRVIVLYSTDDDLREPEWLQAAATSPAFHSLHDPVEDIYSITDGRPFHVVRRS